MTREVRVAKEHRCERCGKGFSDLMDFQRHVAGEHTPKTLRNIHTTRDIAHHPVAKQPGMPRMRRQYERHSQS